MTMTTYHLLNDIGMYKATVVRNFRDNDRGPEYDHVRDLLAKRTQRYTIAELRELSGFFWTSHDECVCENDYDYSAVECYTASVKIKNGEAAVERIERLAAEAATTT
jgi:hypothetical protein